MKKLLFVIPTLRMGGAEKALVSLLKSLDHDLVDADLFLFEGGGVLQKEVPEWINIIEADEVTRAMTLEARFYLKQLVKHGHLSAALSRLMTSIVNKLGYHVFSWNTVKKHIPSNKKHYDVSIGFLEGTADYFVIDKCDADKKIGWIHTDLGRRDFLQEEIEYYNCFDNLVTITEKCKMAACTVIPGIENKICVIENLILPEEILNKSQERIDVAWKDCFQIVTVSRLEYDKGIDIGAKAAKLLRDKGVDFEWHVLGYGSQEEKIKEYIRSNSLVDAFILHGMISNPYPYMKKADIIVQPSRKEGKSIVLDEAKILGKAIVVTDYPSVRDQIRDNETGIIVSIDSQSIAEGIEKLISNISLRNQLEENCLQEEDDSQVILDLFYTIIGVN